MSSMARPKWGSENLLQNHLMADFVLKFCITFREGKKNNKNLGHSVFICITPGRTTTVILSQLCITGQSVHN